jgi:DNA-directed RNA polymerase sigma subunit (sigma70/sigma32)
MVSAAIAQARAVARAAKARWKRERIDQMLAQIAAGRERNAAIAEARALGSRLQEIGTALGLTRQRIDQICRAHARKQKVEATHVRERQVGQPARASKGGQ